MSNMRFKNALNKTPQDIPPIWMMRQAGRYHSHYQELRKKYSFVEMCKIPNLAAQVALGPISDFDFDVAILFSDLLFPLEALGLKLTYDHQGPHLERKPLELSWEEALPQLEFQREALIETKKILPKEKSLIGFVGGPWTLYSYFMEGGHKGDLTIAKKNLENFLDFNKTIIPLLKGNIELQLDGGAEIILMIDTAAGALSPNLFKKLIVPAIEATLSDFDKKVGLYFKGIHPDHLNHIFFSNPKIAGIGFDHRWDLTKVFELPLKGFVQGNFDQALLHADIKSFPHLLEEWLVPFKKLSQKERAGWICGLGHGILPQTPMQNVKKFVTFVREYFYES